MKSSTQTMFMSIAVAVIMLVSIPSSWAAGDDVALLKQEIAALKAQVAQLEQKISAHEKTSPALIQDDQDQFDPFADMEAMQRRMQMMMGGFPPMMNTGASIKPMHRGIFAPDYDIKENDKAYVFTFDMPGMDKSKINVEVKEGRIIISGERSSEETQNNGNKFYRQERSFGYFSKVIPLPENAKGDTVSAKYDNGVLVVTVDKKEAGMKKEAAAKKVDIK